MPRGLREELKKIKKTLEEMRLTIKYQEFDLEATRRERDYFKKLSEGKR